MSTNTMSNTNNNINSDDDSVLVYIGSATDILPIENALADTFVYVDALPDAKKDPCFFSTMDEYLNELLRYLERRLLYHHGRRGRTVHFAFFPEYHRL